MEAQRNRSGQGGEFILFLITILIGGVIFVAGFATGVKSMNGTVEELQQKVVASQSTVRQTYDELGALQVDIDQHRNVLAAQLGFPGTADDPAEATANTTTTVPTENTTETKTE